ncbi:hypothetical protein NUITMVRE34_02170 [Enterococcus gallinarum]|nr:hypothetical protein NUITMVRE34_02170 [Enterococcus gallinarum]GMS50265.1 hypothetical protein NUITMVRE35_04000 [Enterococcus gallinarum]
MTKVLSQLLLNKRLVIAFSEFSSHFLKLITSVTASDINLIDLHERILLKLATHSGLDID